MDYDIIKARKDTHLSNIEHLRNNQTMPFICVQYIILKFSEMGLTVNPKAIDNNPKWYMEMMHHFLAQPQQYIAQNFDNTKRLTSTMLKIIIKMFH